MPEITFSPRQTFRNNKALAGQWNDISASEAFIQASSAALMQMQIGMTADTDAKAAANYYKLEGAKHVIRIMMNLTSSDQDRPDVSPNQNLNHRA